MYDFYQQQRSPLSDKKEYNNFSQETFYSRKKFVCHFHKLEIPS
ncbi:unnamed protein product [Brugia pahangi]|uniref:Uncharacterized protein n=1 Tax=Brugia pahangi TaxID=6280 RepID=A0A0N4T2W7_BRUPA|nr:unnamed protein product [Brugia pahangi]